jgi:hypothetical protein
VLLGLLTLLNAVGDARAHRLDASCSTQRVRKIQVESWFSDDSRPKDATVHVFRATDGLLLTEGRTNHDGVYTFFAGSEPLRVVVDAGEGHRKELTIAGADQDVTTPIPVSTHDTALPIKDILLGIGLLLAASAFALSLRNARRLREFIIARERP